MNVSYLEAHLKSGGSIPISIVDEMDIYKYKRDKRATTSLNKALDTTYQAVYRREYEIGHQWNADNLHIDSGGVFIVTSDNRVLKFDNSEWFSVTKVESHKYDS